MKGMTSLLPSTTTSEAELAAAIRQEATAIDLLARLAWTAPNREHAEFLAQTLEYRKQQLSGLSYQYAALTGRAPLLHIDHVPFHSYEEGLQRAFETSNNATEEINAYRDMTFQDYGPRPLVFNIEEATKRNRTFRTALWTGEHMQLTLMSIDVGDDIGLEVHPTTDQFIRIEEGQGLVRMGDSRDRLDFEARVQDDYAILVPAGKWHNLINTGSKPLKVYAIYAPPEHPHGTVHITKAEAMAAE
ncbi:cupin domain-containing protein [Paenibacillus soyae]|uniref:Cupin domain-containing protein n=1 Tax=Paenibacillus soyae TaxID=2969249 RepID=A0A9X2MSC2_9BACL|nr:cupin domain-containing protein [Paenibacillus soyae]MCR2804856.1 cupin domain-containing protein [Paenibacillus soyae]